MTTAACNLHPFTNGTGCHVTNAKGENVGAVYFLGGRGLDSIKKCLREFRFNWRVQHYNKNGSVFICEDGGRLPVADIKVYNGGNALAVARALVAC